MTGFKSFVEPTEFVIVPGITGVVGPNGCGKSNLVEALRWVMGEASAKRMRGEEMDDVIFGGTADRPPRNLAEVTVVLDNSRRTAPAAFNHFGELEVTRRIERGAGSDYRINGKLVRARDVQLLFQDNASGSASPALVSQGRLGALISARATERRLLIEEAAGILGLHSRRHEAEIRLRAAENNLTRLDDVIGAMETQLAGLKKQVRQAARYRNLSERIRRAEAVVLHLRWQAAGERLRAARAAFDAAEVQVRERTLAAGQASTAQAEAAAALPPLRRAEAEAAAALQRLILARDGLHEEERRVADAQRDARRRLEQVQGDIGRERGLAADAGAALARLEEERAVLLGDQEGEAGAEQAATSALAAVQEAVAALEADLTALTEQAAADEAQRQSLLRRQSECESRAAALARRLDDAARQRADLEREIAAAPDLAAAEAELVAAEAALEQARADAEAAEKARHVADADLGTAREAAQTADSVVTKLKAEAGGLRAALDHGAADGFPPVLDRVTVEPGWEGALGAGLGDDLNAPLDPAAPLYWRDLPPLDGVAPLPDGAESLAGRVTVPSALARRLAHVGVVPDRDAGEALAPALRPGQELVTRDGARWRWDGLCAAAGAPSPAAVHLRQRNRLAELSAQAGTAEAEAVRAREALAAARDAAQAAQAAERAARQAVQAAYTAQTQARDRHAKLAQAAAARQSRLAALAETQERLAADRAEADQALAAAREGLAALPDLGARRERIADMRAALAERRTEQTRCQNALDLLRREAAGRRQRLKAIELDERTWRNRAEGTADRLAELEARAAESETALAALAERPAEIAAQREALMDRIGTAEAERRRAADALAAAETAQREADRALKAAETALVEVREARVRADAEIAAARTNADTVRERIAERLECRPEGVAVIAQVGPDTALPEPGAAEAALDRLLRERDAMGPVNLRADTEAAELEQQVAGMINERKDLLAAIARLRQGIASLNREARERLLGSFETVDRHFQALFVRLFGGGRAHLKLTETDEPLEAGLEIFASPPGKRLQHLSLLSGGEQALTAIALLFAVFLTNPAPICVLDEVDAPLDDANVDRFCTLLEELAAAGSTRFLIVTHHRMTMARVDRLFGVTMPERGVSQLVSVDLQQAVALREPA